MTSAFPAPILAVAAEAVYQLEESNDVLQGLWTVFTKCKSSIKDGHRLENATWRLWYRELSLEPKPYRPPTPDSPKDVPFPAEGIGHRPTQGNTTSQGFLKPPTCARQVRTTPIATSPGIHQSSPPSPLSPSSLTKFIHEILPSTSPLALPTSTNTATPPTVTSNSAITVSASTTALTASHPSVIKPGAPAAIVVPPLQVDPVAPKSLNTSDHPAFQASTTLPTPAAEPTYSPLASFVSVPANTVLTLPPVTFPRVIIVDPTPSPTPHPTPPATPVATVALASVNSVQKGNCNEAAQVPCHSTEEPLPQGPTITPQSRVQHRDRDALPHSDGPSSLSPLANAQWSSSYFDRRNSSADSMNPSWGSQASPLSKTDDSPDGVTSHSTVKSTPVPPTKSAQSTLKPSDRRFFLQQSPEGDDTGGDASSSCNGGDGSSTNSHDLDGLDSKGDRRGKETSTTVSMPPPPPPPIAKASSDIASSVASNESKAHSTAGSRPGPQNRAVQRKGGKVQVRAGGGKTARPPLMQRRSHSSGNFGAKLGGGLGMTSTTTNTAQKGSTTELAKAATSIKSTVPKVKSATALETTTKATRQTSTSGRDLKKADAAGSSAGVGKPGKKAIQVAPETRSSNTGPMAPPPLLSRASEPQVSQMSTSTTGRKKIVIANTSSEYETETETDSGDDDDSWASEEEAASKAQVQPPPGNSRSRNGRTRPTAAELQASWRLEEAAREAQRQRELFARVPKRTYSDIFEKKRSQTGLLTKLMHPDPSIFPPGHPYHNPAANKPSHSTQDLGSWRRSNSLQTSKSAAALPLAARVQVEAGSVSAAAPIQNQPGSSASSNRPGPSSGYRPRGPPQEQEMEDDSGSESNPEDKVSLPKSLAQQKLAALAGRRSNVSLKQNQQPQPPMQRQEASRSPQEQLAPIPVTHPYNLPVPAMPSTPRTTRRLMLQQEMSESLRRNLLWERQVSKTNIARRTHSISSTNIHPHAQLETTRQAPAALRRHASGGMIGDVLAPLATVRASATGQHSRRTSESAAPWLNPADQQAQERDRRRAERRETHERNRNWANDDFHTAGW